jgi:hypothetical protein
LPGAGVQAELKRRKHPSSEPIRFSVNFKINTLPIKSLRDSVCQSWHSDLRITGWLIPATPEISNTDHAAGFCAGSAPHKLCLTWSTELMTKAENFGDPPLELEQHMDH